ncbi:MAG: hypothetical protein ACE363_02165 [Alphaproteobacteria bacterium]
MTKELFSLAATALTFIAYWPYIRSIQRGEVKPHVFSWIIWGMVTVVVFGAQLAGGAGVGAWPIGISGLIGFYVAVLAYLKKADDSITRSDWVFFAAAMSSLPLWYFTDDPLYAVIILSTVDVLGFGPTLRKAYVRPFDEQLLFFVLMALRNGLALAALEHYSATTVLFPAVTALACLVFLAVVGYRRRVLPHTQNSP